MFKSLKTVVVTLTILAVGYGAHVVLNHPLPSDDNPFASMEGWNTPNLTLRDGESLRPDIGLDSSYGAPNSLSPQVSVPTPGPASLGGTLPQDPEANNNSYAVMPPVAGRGNREDRPPLLPLTSHTAPSPTAVTPDSATVMNGSVDPSQAVADYGEASNVPAASLQPPVAVDGTYDNGWDANVRNVSAIRDDAAGRSLTGIEDSFEAIWNSAQAKLASQDYAQALFTLSLCYGDPSLTSEQLDRILPLLDQLAGTVIYSQESHLMQPHSVQPGETVADIARRYSIPPLFLVRVNGLRPDVALQPGQTLKVVQGPFSARLSLAERELTLFLNRYYAGRFAVSVGRDAPSEEVVLQVVEESGARLYQDPATGQQIPPNDPTNPYGGHWIGLQAPGSTATNLAIHSAGVQLDASDTRGCFSVSSKDADDLMAILSIGSRVSVVR